MNKSTVKAIEDFLMVKSDALEKALLCFCFGFPRKELYEAAVKIFKSGLCDYILISGGINKKSPDTAFDKSLKNITEAEWQRDNLIKTGVPKEKILIETKRQTAWKMCYSRGRLLLNILERSRRKLLSCIRFFTVEERL